MFTKHLSPASIGQRRQEFRDTSHFNAGKQISVVMGVVLFNQYGGIYKMSWSWLTVRPLVVSASLPVKIKSFPSLSWQSLGPMWSIDFLFCILRIFSSHYIEVLILPLTSHMGLYGIPTIKPSVDKCWLERKQLTCTPEALMGMFKCNHGWPAFEICFFFFCYQNLCSDQLFCLFWPLWVGLKPHRTPCTSHWFHYRCKHSNPR